MSAEKKGDKVFEAIELARATGKLSRGTNEVTKSIEKGTAKLVAVAKDVTPPEVVMHLPLLSKDKGILCILIDSKEELGAAAGLEIGTAAVAIIQEGDAKPIIKELLKESAASEKPATPEEDKKDAPKEEKKENPAETKKEEAPSDDKKESPAEKKEKATSDDKKEEKPAEEVKDEKKE